MIGCIFDMDATLVDTTQVYADAYVKVIDEIFGVKVKQSEITSRFGKKSEVIVAEVLNNHNIDASKVALEDITQRVRNDVRININKVKLLPGVVEFLEELSSRKNQYKLAVGTSSKKYIINLILKRFKLLKYFDIIVTACDVVNAKPDPEIFIKAACLLNISPEKCIVFEDSLYGIIAAQKAGMHVIAVASGPTSKKELIASNPDLVVNSFKELSITVINNVAEKVWQGY